MFTKKFWSHPGTVIVATLIGAYVIVGFVTGNWEMKSVRTPAVV